MITLREGSTFTNVEWAEVVTRPEFSANVDPESVKLNAIVASYLEPQEVPCGLSSCRQPHKRGYFVSVEGSSGVALTNMGHLCGRRHFDVEFEDMARAFDKEKRIQSYRDALAAYQRRLNEFDSRVYELRTCDLGADWAHKHMGFLRDPGFGIDDARLAVMRMVKSDDDRIMIGREATRAEIDAQEATGQPVNRIVETEVGRLDGIFALRPENDLRQLLVVDLEAGLSGCRA